jgi:hypothetical protein
LPKTIPAAEPASVGKGREKRKRKLKKQQRKEELGEL